MDSRRECLSSLKKHLQLDDKQRASNGTHAGLWFDKYIEQQELKDDERARNQQEQDKPNKESPRTAHVCEVAQIPIHDAYRPYFRAWEDTLRHSGAKLYQATALGRMSVGLGDKSVLETSVELHQT